MCVALESAGWYGFVCLNEDNYYNSYMIYQSMGSTRIVTAAPCIILCNCSVEIVSDLAAAYASCRLRLPINLGVVLALC